MRTISSRSLSLSLSLGLGLGLTLVSCGQPSSNTTGTGGSPSGVGGEHGGTGGAGNSAGGSPGAGGHTGSGGASGAGTGGLTGAGGSPGTGGVGAGGSLGTGGRTAGTGGTTTGVGGTTTVGGTGGSLIGTGGSSAGSGGTTGGVSDIPVPAGPGNVAQPAGAVGGFKILNWGGFKGAVSFTFDDALQSQIDNYALLKATGVRMTFYLVCNNDGSKAGWKQMAMDGQEIGNHTEHHCNADGTSCGWGTFTNTSSELDDCTAHLKSAFGVKDVYTMAAPMGDTGWDTPGSTRFLANRGVADTANGIAPNDNTDAYNLPCHVANQSETAVGGFNTVTDSTASKGIWRTILNHSLGNNDGYHPVDPKEVAAAMTYAKGLGTVWVDSLVNVAAYWRAQKVISGLTPTTSGTAQTWTWTLPAHYPPGRYLRVTVTGGTLKQNGAALPWDSHGYYEIAMDAGSVTLSP